MESIANPRVRTSNRRVTFWLPASFLAIAAVVQAVVWQPPPEIRWDGTLREWPIPWMVCCGSVAGFLFVVIPYLIACVLFFIGAVEQGRRWLVVNLLSLLGFQFAVYGILWLHYFG